MRPSAETLPLLPFSLSPLPLQSWNQRCHFPGGGARLGVWTRAVKLMFAGEIYSPDPSTVDFHSLFYSLPPLESFNVYSAEIYAIMSSFIFILCSLCKLKIHNLRRSCTKCTLKKLQNLSIHKTLCLGSLQLLKDSLFPVLVSTAPRAAFYLIRNCEHQF